MWGSAAAVWRVPRVRRSNSSARAADAEPPSDTTTERRSPRRLRFFPSPLTGGWTASASTSTASAAPAASAWLTAEAASAPPEPRDRSPLCFRFLP